jgi:DNA-directed RNA polymerase III subunit RPC1
MEQHGVSLDPHYTSLLADVMTYTGNVLGFTRNGIDKMRVYLFIIYLILKLQHSTLMLASFEKTVEYLFDAAAYGYVDEIRGVSERIIVGQNISLGTGSFGLIMNEKLIGEVSPFFFEIGFIYFYNIV